MRSLFNQSDKDEIIARLNNLTSHSERQWGKMTVAQMLAHCHAALETASGLDFPKRTFIGMILGPFFKSRFVGENRFDKNLPTDKNYIFVEGLEFEKQREKAIVLIEQFYNGAEEKCTKHPHSFFGKLTPQQWAGTQWKHFDHHLRQFGA